MSKGNGSGIKQRDQAPDVRESSRGDLTEILGAPALLRTESAEAYDALYNEVRSALMPEDIIDELLVKEYVDLAWDNLRLRPLTTRFYFTGRPLALRNALEPMFDNDSAEPIQLSSTVARGHRKGSKHVSTLL